MKKWILRLKRADYNAISKKFGISRVVARIIRNRDIITDEEIGYFLNATVSDMHDPFLMKNMDMACKLILNAIANNKSIRIVGDYDIDGICATTILIRGLRAIGANVSYRLPHRVNDGYGLSAKIIDEAANDDVDMIVTCDNGIAALSEIAYAKKIGIDVIVTDHHEIQFKDENGKREYTLPDALCVVDPHQPDDGYPFPNICGAMVAYKVILGIQKCIKNGYGESIHGNINGELTDVLFDFAAFATVGDIMPLIDENRIAVKYGLKSMSSTKNIGLSALIDVTGVKRNSLSTYHIGYILGPCVNATGRLDTADKSLELFLTDDYDEAMKLAKELKETNDLRKAITDTKVKEATEIVETGSDGHDYSKDTVLVVYMKDCHESLAGLIAGRLKEQFFKPTIVFTDVEHGIKGSGRSIEAYNIFEELSKFKDMFIKFGGHPMACGLTIRKEDFEKLRRIVNDSSTLKEEDLIGKYYIDVDMPINYVTQQLIDELKILEPFGQGNPSPLFAQKDLKVLSRKKNPKGNMVTLVLKSDECEDVPERTMYASMFGDADSILDKISGQDSVTIAYVPEHNDYFDRIQINIKDIK